MSEPRRYACGRVYTPVALEDRKYGINRPDDPRAERFHTKWFLPLELAEDEAREMPETRPDEQTLEHRAICTCDVCQRPEARKYWRSARRASQSHR